MQFYWWFSSDIVTVKGLRFKHQTTEDRPTCLFASFEKAFSTERVVTLCSFQLFASPDRRILLSQCFLIFPDGHVIVLFVENCILVLNGKLYIYVPDKWRYGQLHCNDYFIDPFKKLHVVTNSKRDKNKNSRRRRRVSKLVF